MRSVVHELERSTDKLSALMTQYRSLIEQRPQARGGSPEAKKAHEEQLGKWNRAVDRQMRRINKAHEEIVEATRRLDQAASGKLPTALGKDVANARNAAEAERVGAEQVLAKYKPAPTRAKKGATKQAKSAPENDKIDDSILDDL